MELKQYWNLILKNLSAVLILSFAGAVLGIFFSLTTPKLYKSESQIFVSTPVSGLDITALAQGSSFSEQRVISYAKLINGPITLVPVIKQLGLKMTYAELSSEISSSAPLGTVLINISVSDNSPIRAAAIANAVAVQFGETVKTLELPQFGDQSGIKSTIVRTGEIPSSPYSPNTKLNLLTGLFFGFIIACLIGIVRQIFDSSVKNANHLSGKPLLSTIFFDPGAVDSPVMSGDGNYSVRAESFRHLRTSLKFENNGTKCEVIAITSAFPGEGKTTTSINLALAFAQTGLKVALIEADLRRPSFKKYLKSEDSSNLGLTEILDRIEAGKSPKRFEGFFQTYGEKENCIEWLGSGTIPQNPAEKLESSAMSKFIQVLRKEYDIVILDTPPTLPVTDAASLSTKVDHVIVVARAGVTKQSHLSGVMEILGNLNANILGVVLNMVPLNVRGEEYGYAYTRYSPKYGQGSKYGYGYGYGKSEPYGPLLLPSEELSTENLRIPLDIRLKAKFKQRKKVAKVEEVVEVKDPEMMSAKLEFESFLKEIKKEA